MTTPDAEDASPSPEYSGDPDGSDMAAEQKTESQSGDASPSQKTSNGQKAGSNAKDPLRPRRKKARRACYACQRAHLTCGDERPCNRCIRRGLQDHCMDGVRKKAKYLHDAPDGALMPGVGGHYPHMNGNRPVPLPSQDPSTVQPGNYYTQAPSTTYYPPNSTPGRVSTGQDASTAAFNGQQAPISPPYSQTNQAPIPNAPNTVSQEPSSQLPHFGPLFDPSDPAIFNFDISGLNFGNHYGALEFGMLGHMSSGAAETPPHESTMINPLNQAANMYNPQMSSGPYNDHSNMQPNMAFGQDGLPVSEWQNTHSRHGSMQIQTPNNTPVTATLDQGGNRHDSLTGPQAYAIGQGPSSISSASPASTDMNSGYDNDNPLSAATFFANSNQQQTQRSPTVTRLPHDNRLGTSALQPIQANLIRKRQRETKAIYEGITKPYDYVRAFHRLLVLMQARYPPSYYKKAVTYLGGFRPLLLETATELTEGDLVHQEKNLQRSLLTLQDHCADVGTPCLIFRRTGEIVGMNKEFAILTGWKREILLGHERNLNVNMGVPPDPTGESGLSTQTNTTPNMTGQEPDSGLHPVNIIELLDTRSALQYLQKFSELCYQDSRGMAAQRVHMLKYRTKEDVARIEELKASAISNGKPVKTEPLIKVEGGPTHPGEAGIHQLGAKDGMVDCMIMWHIKRDNFDMPMLVCMAVMPVLKA